MKTKGTLRILKKTNHTNHIEILYKAVAPEIQASRSPSPDSFLKYITPSCYVFQMFFERNRGYSSWLERLKNI